MFGLIYNTRRYKVSVRFESNRIRNIWRNKSGRVSRSLKVKISKFEGGKGVEIKELEIESLGRDWERECCVYGREVEN